MAIGKKILVVPDGQVKPGVPLEHWTWIGQYIAEKQPDIIVNIGDWADMPSLSSYDVGKKSFEGRRYVKDIEAIRKAQDMFEAPIRDYNQYLKQEKKKLYKPEKIIALGNHEERINRVIESDPKLEGVLSMDDLGYQANGWTVYPYLEVVIRSGVCFSHFFTSGVMGRPVSSPAALLAKKHMSCVMGHVQQEGIATQYKADGSRITAIFAGCSYLHSEDYLGPQGNQHWRGIWMLHDVQENGSFDIMPVSLSYLRKKYG